MLPQATLQGCPATDPSLAWGQGSCQSLSDRRLLSLPLSASLGLHLSVPVVLGEVPPTPPRPPHRKSHFPRALLVPGTLGDQSPYALGLSFSRILWSFLRSCRSVWVCHSVCLSPTISLFSYPPLLPPHPSIPASFPPDSPCCPLWPE